MLLDFDRSHWWCSWVAATYPYHGLSTETVLSLHAVNLGGSFFKGALCTKGYHRCIVVDPMAPHIVGYDPGKCTQILLQQAFVFGLAPSRCACVESN